MTKRTAKRLVEAYDRLRRRGPAASYGYRRMRFPTLERLGHDVFAKILLSILHKAPLPVGELRLRAGLEDDELLSALREKAPQYGRQLMTYSLADPLPRTLLEALDAGDSYSFTHLGPVDGQREELRAYVYNSLIEGVRRKAQHAATSI